MIDCQTSFLGSANRSTPEQRSHSPQRRHSEYDCERNARQPIRHAAFAPALERSRDSNQKQQNCADRESFDPHVRHLPTHMSVAQLNLFSQARQSHPTVRTIRPHQPVATFLHFQLPSHEASASRIGRDNPVSLHLHLTTTMILRRDCNPSPRIISSGRLQNPEEIREKTHRRRPTSRQTPPQLRKG